MQSKRFDVRAARERLEMSPEALADALGMKPRKVRAWESGAAPVPERTRTFVEWRLALAEQGAAMKACGLPACEWLEAQRQAFGNTPDNARRMQLAHMVKAHMESCDVCAARERWASENRVDPLRHHRGEDDRRERADQPGGVRRPVLLRRLPCIPVPRAHPPGRTHTPERT